MSSASGSWDGQRGNDEETQRQTAALYHLLGEIGLTKPGEYRWFNASTHPELGGRTPTGAWLAGDHEGVKSLVLSWYEATTRARRRVVEDPEMMAFLRRRLAELDKRYGTPGRTSSQR